MSSEFVTVLVVLFVVTLWIAAKHTITALQIGRQREIARRGITCQGKVVAIQRPFLLDDCTRLYFDFLPDGCEEAIRACHIDRRSDDETVAPLPAQGTLVSVRYLPEHPTRAVIGKLIS